MTNLRNNTLRKLGKYNVINVRDYLIDQIEDLHTGKKEKTNLPKSNVLYYELEDDAWCCVRPSGTEPKIKFYLGTKGSSNQEAINNINELEKAVRELL